MDASIAARPSASSFEKAGKTAGKDKGIYDIHVIDVYLTSARSNTWVFDTSSVAHICNSQEELQNKRRLARNEVTMRVGNAKLMWWLSTLSLYDYHLG